MEGAANDICLLNYHGDEVWWQRLMEHHPVSGTWCEHNLAISFPHLFPLFFRLQYCWCFHYPYCTLYYCFIWNNIFEHLIYIYDKSHSVVSDSLWPHGLYSPWDSPGQNTEVGSLSLLQSIFSNRGSNPGLLHCRWILYQVSHKGNPSGHMLQQQ